MFYEDKIVTIKHWVPEGFSCIKSTHLPIMESGDEGNGSLHGVFGDHSDISKYT